MLVTLQSKPDDDDGMEVLWNIEHSMRGSARALYASERPRDCSYSSGKWAAGASQWKVR